VTLDQLKSRLRWLDRALWVVLVVDLGLVVLLLWQHEASYLWSLVGALICCLGLLRGRNRSAIADERDRLQA
jgi:hypothetical protein